MMQKNRGPSKIQVVNRFFSGTGFSYDRVAAIGTCGFDGFWKKKIIARIPANPARIMDQACGTGILTIEIARAFPGCRVVGVELRDEYLSIARQKAAALKIKNIEFILGRAEDVLLDEGYDCITSSYLAKYAELGILIANAKKMLRSGGFLIMHDFMCPSNPVFFRLWLTYLRLLRIVGGRIFPEWRTVFRELPEFIRQSRWVEETLFNLGKNGFCDIENESLTFGASAIITARKT